MNKSKTIFIGIISYKGGVGKTMTALNLARAFSDEGLHVVLIDDDKNKTAINWATRRASNDLFQVLGMFAGNQYAGERDVVIYDTPGGMDKSEMKDVANNCDFVIVPCKPDRESIDATERLASDLSEFGTDFAVLATDAIAAGEFARARAMIEYFAEEKIPHFGIKEIIPSSTKFKDASESGKTIGEMSGGRLFADTFSRIAREILNEIGYEPNLTTEDIEELTENISSAAKK